MKKMIAMLLVTLMSLSLVACGSSEETATEETAAVEVVVEGAETEEVAVEEVVVDNTPVLVVGETATTDKCEFTIDYVNITKDVMPPKPGNWYSHYEAEAGKVYVDFCVAYKNTSGNNVGADDVIFANLKYAGKYEYTGFSMIEEDSRADFTYSNITSIAPLSTEYVHYLFEVPEEVATSSESVEITFNIDGNTYTYKVR